MSSHALHRPFVQVAGHGEILLEADVVVKPSSTHEALFYERAREHAPQLVQYMPEYRGRRDGRSGAKLSIALRNLTHGMHSPSVLDLKVGTWYTSDRCTEDKMRIRQKEAAESTSGSVGLRLCGMRLARSLEIVQANRYLGKVLQPVHLHRIVIEFFSPRPGSPHLPLITAVVSHLEGIRGAVRSAPSLRLFSSSVLVVYDSHHAVSDYAACPPLECKMIDFGQSQLEASRNDDGYVFGIESLLAILRGMLANAPAAVAPSASRGSSGADDDFDDA